MASRFWQLALCLTVALTPGQAVLAQIGGLTIQVLDSDGQPLPGATVTISHELSYVKPTSEISDKAGRVRFPVLRPGRGYRVDVSFPGLSSRREEGVRVKLGDSEILTVQLFSEVKEEVKVTAEREVIDLERTETATKFTDDFIRDLPVLDRFYQNVLVLAPGVQDADGDGNPNVHGSRSRDFQAQVSGVSNVDPLTGQWLSRVNPNSIEEMEVITAGAGVEFGRAQGGFARIVQKQGSNRHEGTLDFIFQTSKFDGQADNALTETDFETIQPGFQFSGPIIRDRLWYRASYERRDREEPIDVVTGVAIFSSDTETRDAQITWQVSPRNKLAFQYRSDPADESNFGVSSVIPAESSQTRGRDVVTGQLTWTAPYSPRVLFDTTVAWQDVNLSAGPSQPGVPNDCVRGFADAFIKAATCTNNSTGVTSGSFNESNSDNRQRLTVKSQATIYAGRFMGGDHQIKLGMEISNERYFRQLERLPAIDFDVVTLPFGEDFGVTLAQVDVPAIDDVRATGNNFAFYAEDQFKPLPNLTLTAGVRIDREELFSQGSEVLDFQEEFDRYAETVVLSDDNDSGVLLYVPGDWEKFFTGYEGILGYRDQLTNILCAGDENIPNCIATTSPELLVQLQEDLVNKRRVSGLDIGNTNFSPFFSVAWDPTGDGKTALKAAFGRHYNNIPLLIPLQELEPVRTSIEYTTDLDTFSTVIDGGIPPNVTLRTVDRGLRTPYQDEFTLSFERQIFPETSAKLTYINRRFEDQLQDRNVNVATGDYGRCASIGLQVLENTNVLPSVIPGAAYVDPFSGEVYVDNTDGPGDGRLDDCGGITEFFPSGQPFVPSIRYQLPDGIPDLYNLNPFWGGVFEIGNLNSVDYEAWILELVRRQYRGWEMNASYTYSEAIGDGEDFIQDLADDPSLRDNLRGFQSYDQRHVVKLNATAITPWGVRLGTSVSWQSGLPYSILLEKTSDDILPPQTFGLVGGGARRRQTYPTGVRNDQRNPAYWNVDLKLVKELRLAQRGMLQLSVELFNALDDQTLSIYNPFFEAGEQVNGVNESQRRFGRRWQVSARANF